MSGNVFGTSKCLQQSFKDFKNLQTVQIVIRITLTTVTSVLSKHILHTLSNVSPPIGRDNHAEGMVQKTRFLIDKTLKPLCSPLNLTQLRTHDHQNLNLTPPSGEKKFWPKSIFLVFSNLFDPKLTRNGLKCR